MKSCNVNFERGDESFLLEVTYDDISAWDFEIQTIEHKRDGAWVPFDVSREEFDLIEHLVRKGIW